MAFGLEDIKTIVDGKLQDDASVLSSAELDACITEALRQLNKDLPRIVIEDISGDGSQDYALPATFIKGVSVIKSVEMPAGKIIPVFRRRREDWFEYEDPTLAPNELRLRFKRTTPAGGATPEVIRLRMTTDYVLTPTSTIDSDQVFSATIAKSLELGFCALAAEANTTVDSGITADTVDRLAQSAQYRDLSDKWKAIYRQMVNLGDTRVPAFAFAEKDLRFPTGDDFLWHPSRTR